MSSGHRDGVIGRGMWRAALAAAVLVAGAGAPSAAAAASPSPLHAGSAWGARAAVRGTPSQVIDAKTNPQLAGQTLNSGCANLANCSWTATTPISPPAYGPPRILGDALYNCSDEEYAETSVGIADERGQSTSISETLSLEVQFGFLGLEKATAEFKLFSKQAESFSTKVTSTNAVAVPPMWKGWTQTEVLTATVGGNAYITEGINLIEVKDIDLSFPGFAAPGTPAGDDVKYIGYRTPMTADDITSRCNAISGLGRARLGPAPPGSFKLTLCRVAPVEGRRSVSGVKSRRRLQTNCANRKVSGIPPPPIRQATAVLTRHGRTYAAGNDTHGRIRLTERRKIAAGKYRLIIKQKPNMDTVIPVKIR